MTTNPFLIVTAAASVSSAASGVFALVAVVVTIACNVRLSSHLAGVDVTGLSTADAQREWQAYFGPWTTWNHVRTVAPLIGSVLLAVGLRYR
jgi:uncharacterized membrane protein